MVPGLSTPQNKYYTGINMPKPVTCCCLCLLPIQKRDLSCFCRYIFYTRVQEPIHENQDVRSFPCTPKSNASGGLKTSAIFACSPLQIYAQRSHQNWRRRGLVPSCPACYTKCSCTASQHHHPNCTLGATYPAIVSTTY